MMDIQELVDLTIDFLYDSRADLKRCALVCSSWRPSAQYHLFSYYVLQNEIDCKRLCGLLDASPRICHLITHLAIALCPKEIVAYELMGKMEFTHLQKLSLYSLPPTPALDVMQRLFSLPSITHIFMLRQDDTRPLSLFLRRTERLGTLELSPRGFVYSHIPHDGEQQLEPSPATRCAVDCLHLDDRRSLDLFAKVLDFSSLRRLIVRNCVEAESLNHLLQRCASVSDLEVHGVIADTRAFGKQLLIGPPTLTHLVHFTFHVLAPSALMEVPLLLAQFGPASRLRQVTLVTSRDAAPTSTALASFPHADLWRTVDAAIDVLQSVSLMIKVSLMWGGIRESERGVVTLRECFPHLAGNRRVQVTVINSTF
ncbi:hypothetical protein FB451DRAFT_42957 [Mycena latifolia]|nr:hypothetical protein FB451DRAFT_42957 [Mycena latifolia]